MRSGGPPCSLHQQHRQSPAQCSRKGFWILCNAETTRKRRKHLSQLDPIQRLQNFIDILLSPFFGCQVQAVPPSLGASGSSRSSRALEYLPRRWERRESILPAAVVFNLICQRVAGARKLHVSGNWRLNSFLCHLTTQADPCTKG